MSETIAVKNSFTIDLDGYADQKMRVVWDNITYELRFQWNERDESWFMSIGDVGSDPILSFKLTSYIDVLKPFRCIEGVPQGRLCIDSLEKATKERAGRYNIGFMLSITLVYYSLEE